MAKSTMLISIDQELKEKWQLKAKEMGTNASNLVSMVMVQFLSSKRPNKYLDLEIEPFSDEEINSMKNDKELQKRIEKMNRLLAKRTGKIKKC